MQSIVSRIAQELGVEGRQVQSAVDLLDEGATVPFIARYRKERTGGLDDAQLRDLEERLGYLRELEGRRETILKSIDEQGKLDPTLKAEILAADTKTRLEDLYLPYKPKRRTKAQIAREAGLEPLAETLLGDPTRDPEAQAGGFVDAEKGVADTAAALEGARQILMERFAEDAGLLAELRDYLWSEGRVRSQVVAGKEREAAKFADYFEYEERIDKIPSHRALALFRGRNEGLLDLTLETGEETGQDARGALATARRFGIERLGRPADDWLWDSARRAWRIKIFTHLSLELMGRLREAAEEEAIRVFGSNLKDLLLAAPAGAKVIIGLDPGIRTGVKVAVVDATGKVVDTATIYPHEPRRDWEGSLRTLEGLARKHQAALTAIGNGTASRETDKLAAELLKRLSDQPLSKMTVSEAGASVYSASKQASEELPELDVTLRGAVSIARRLQDPLAELVKIDPKSIGVGQYQHDVNQSRLALALDKVVEDCVNSVGVDANTASAALLARVSGLSRTQAENVVRYRNEHGAFADRKGLLKVPRLGDKAFEQAAGFLRIHGGANPLDASAVHPEAYPVVERILANVKTEIGRLIGDRQTLQRLDPKAYTDERFGQPTVQDILAELEKPGRDPRGEFKTASFQDGIEELKDLQPGMILEGVVSNVANFGAFVDLGVHQDGLVHISALSDKFVKDPREVVRTGDLVKVKVMAVDLERRRIALSMRLDDVPGEARKGSGGGPAKAKAKPKAPPKARDSAAKPAGALADALSSAFGKR